MQYLPKWITNLLCKAGLHLWAKSRFYDDYICQYCGKFMKEVDPNYDAS